MNGNLKIEHFSLKDNRVEDFTQLPNVLFKDLPFWITPLRVQIKENFSLTKNPFWKFVESRLFIVYRDKQMLGRIAAVYHPGYNSIHTKKTGFFGFLDAVDDAEVFKLLFEGCAAWLKEFNVSRMIGPLNPSLNYELGVLVDGFDRFPKFMMPYNPEYYNQRILQSGFEKSVDFYAYDLDRSAFQLSPRMTKVKIWLESRFEITFVNIDFSKIKTDAKKVFEIYNDAFEGHWGFTPFELEEVTYMAYELKAIVDEDLFFFIYINGSIAGYILALPDLNEAIRHLKNGRLLPFGLFKLLYYSKKIKRIRVLNVGVKSKYRHLGLGVLLYEELQRRMGKKNYEGGELSWVVENNPDMNQGAQEIGAKVVKKYRIYERGL